MATTIELFCIRLEKINTESDYLMEDLYNATELIEIEEDISGAFDAIFTLIENNPNTDFGSPGPLVHLIEQYYPKYAPNLIQSVQSKPTLLTTWMINRILNSKLTAEKREEYIQALDSVKNNATADKEIKEQAQHYIDLQTCESS